ncbi:hypothetical protein GI584_17065 [Gracilibacillus salitolerans]|uniref:Uncharacterized protein n=1 Tax=Gracilibacillus salitolerans TaxID=2663022 RepID=A0A5Q2TLW6_9BACI|nr:hypothetical protein [Gracilibacillus salitolerans]QGH35655.1 hypothetical protein GI584_17065 [Gracilibacillus salitolerans]
MKKLWISILLLFLIPTTLHALSWAYTFVVLDGRVYEVTDEQINAALISKSVGEVTTQADDHTGKFYGNASNHFPIGTKYFKMEGTDINDAIAVEEQGTYLKAEFVERVPFHWRNILYYLTPILFLIGLIIIYRAREKVKKNYQNSLS